MENFCEDSNKENDLYVAGKKDREIVEIISSKGVIYVLLCMSMKVQRNYIEEYNNSKDFRKAFCHLVVSMIKASSAKIVQVVDDIELDDIEKLDDLELIKVLKKLIESSRYLSEYYNKNVTENHFEEFYNAVKYEEDECLKEFKETVDNFSKQINNYYKSIFDSIKPINEHIRKSINESFKPIQESMKNFTKMITEAFSVIDFKELPEDNKKLAVRMVEQGWYFSLELPFNCNYLMELKDEDFNNELLSFYEKYEDEMMNRILNQYPHREVILKKVFKAHKSKDYELSIPAMFTQVDGISEEIFKKTFFSKYRNGVLKTSNQSEVIFNQDSFIDISFCIQLATIGDLTETYRPTVEKCNKFNRNTVLHGTDINYGKKINSIKCLVMLNFLSEIKEHYCNNV